MFQVWKWARKNRIFDQKTHGTLIRYSSWHTFEPSKQSVILVYVSIARCEIYSAAHKLHLQRPATNNW
jgi:hypothetical protein